MRNLIIFLTLIFSVNTYAGNWITETDLATARANGTGQTVYFKQGKCETVESVPCFEISGKDVRYNTVQNVRKGDFESASVITGCADEAACLAAIADPVAKCGDATYSAFWGDLDTDSTLESWCTRRNLIDSLEEDAALKTVADADDAAKVVEQANRNSKRVVRLTDLENCAKSPGLSAPEQQACIIAIAKELVRTRLLESDL